MSPHSNFFISSYQRNPNNLIATFQYHFDDQVYFSEQVDFSCPLSPINTDVGDIHQLLIHTHIALWLSYYKLSPKASIIIQTASLTKEQIAFWHTFYTSGLGEYCVINDIDPHHIAIFQCQSQSATVPITTQRVSHNKALVWIGWGKDSIVSAELLKSMWYDFDYISIGKWYPLHDQVASITQKSVVHISRSLDPLLFQLNTQPHYYNGHVPITGMLAWIKLITAYLYGYNQIILSNEKSSNEWNWSRYGMQINHQRSKSIEFEHLFDNYIQTYITNTIHYFSLLRGMYEIKIVRLFSHFPQYFNTFSSCNNNFKLIDNHKITQYRWCCQCPKCVFVYTSLRPYIDSTQAQKIFGSELYDDASLIPLYEELLWVSGHKPFECVGTNEEMLVSMYTMYQRYQWSNSKLPVVISWFQDTIVPTLSTDLIENLSHKLMTYESGWCIPHDVEDQLQEVITKLEQSV